MGSDSIRQPDSQNDDPRLPPITALRCFEAAARLESFSRAADMLHLTHGAVSRAVRLIEDDLGSALFERRSRRVFLTDSGRRLAMAVREGFGQIGKAAQEIREQNATGAITLSCEPTLLMRWLIPRLPAFHAAHPDIALHLVAAGGPVRLGSGIDLAIRRFRGIARHARRRAVRGAHRAGVPLGHGGSFLRMDSRHPNATTRRPPAPHAHPARRLGHMGEGCGRVAADRPGADVRAFLSQFAGGIGWDRCGDRVMANGPRRHRQRHTGDADRVRRRRFAVRIAVTQ